MADNKNINNTDISYPLYLDYLLDITNDSYANYILDNSYIIFTSVDNIICLVYYSEDRNIIFYDLTNQQKISELKYHHMHNLTNFQHITDKRNKKDLLMSVSSDDNNIIIWDLCSLKCILNIVKVNNSGVLFSACFLNEQDNIFILTSNCSSNPFQLNFEPIKLFDLNGKRIKEIQNSNDKTFYIDTFYDNNLSKNFIITCNMNYLKSYDYEKNKIYKKYYDRDDGAHCTFIIYKNENDINLMESSNSGIVRIWNFHTAELLKKISIQNERIFGICRWNKEYLFTGCFDGKIRLIQIDTGIVVKTFEGHKSIVLTIKKLNHPKFGECLISKGFKNDEIKIWGLKPKE